MQSKAIVLKLHGGSSDDISSWKKKKGGGEGFDQNTGCQKLEKVFISISD